jgi:hypothetical protein
MKIFDFLSVEKPTPMFLNLLARRSNNGKKNFPLFVNQMLKILTLIKTVMSS